jgi:orotate phosphoribosyltransferase
MLFGPAYKGIPLVAGTAIALAGSRAQRAVQLQPQGSQGPRRRRQCLVGAPLTGRVLIVDDVISAGTSVRESVALIRAAGAMPAGVLIALDRMERGQGELSAVQEVFDCI